MLEQSTMKLVKLSLHVAQQPTPAQRKRTIRQALNCTHHIAYQPLRCPFSLPLPTPFCTIKSMLSACQQHCWALLSSRRVLKGDLLLIVHKRLFLGKFLGCSLTTCFSDAIAVEVAVAAAAATVCLPSPVVLVQSGAGALPPGR